MDRKPLCVIVTGRPGAGKSTLAARLGEVLWMPVVSRDRIKEGYLHTLGVGHEELPPDANGVATGIFFELVEGYLGRGVSVVIEAAFQHGVWAGRLASLEAVGRVVLIECVVDPEVAAERHLARGLEHPERERFHGDERVRHYRETGEVLGAGEYESPRLGVASREYSAVGEEGFEELVEWVRGELKVVG